MMYDVLFFFIIFYSLMVSLRLKDRGSESPHTEEKENKEVYKDWVSESPPTEEKGNKEVCKDRVSESPHTEESNVPSSSRADHNVQLILKFAIFYIELTFQISPTCSLSILSCKNAFHQFCRKGLGHTCK